MRPAMDKSFQDIRNPESQSSKSGMGTSHLPKRNPVQEFESLWGKDQVPNVREFLQKTAASQPKGQTDEPPEPAQWPVVPGYTILAKLGQGGMGQVFKAKQDRLER